MPVPYCFISEPHSGDHITAAFAQMHVTAFNNGKDATVKASCTQDSPAKTFDFDDVTLPASDTVIYLLIYPMPHKAVSSTHKLDLKMEWTGGSDNDTKTGIVMDPPDDPGGGIHKDKYSFVPFRIEPKGNGLTGDRKAAKHFPKMLDGYDINTAFHLASASGLGQKVLLQGSVNPVGEPKQLKLKILTRAPHLKKDVSPAETIRHFANHDAASPSWSEEVETPLTAHGSVLKMEYNLEGSSSAVNLVLPILDESQWVIKGGQVTVGKVKPHVFKIPKP